MHKVYRLDYKKAVSDFVDAFRSTVDAATYCRMMSIIDKAGMYFITKQQ